MDAIEQPAAIEPDTWFVVFHPEPGPSRFFNWLAGRRFRHVSALGYCAGFRAWLVCNAQWSGLRLQLYSHDAMLKLFPQITRGCAIVQVAASKKPMRMSSRLGFYCVPATKHLIGLRSGALRPIGLYRQLLRNGGTLIDAGTLAPAASGRPQSRD